jgi:hypothetical protein
MASEIEKRVNEAAEKIVNDLKALGLDPYIEITTKNNTRLFNIIIPVEQIVNLIKKKSDTPIVKKYIDLEIKEVSVGTKSFIVIKIKSK